MALAHSNRPRKLRDLQPPDPYFGVIRGFVHISEISGVDEAYQRSQEPTHLAKIVKHFNPHLLDPLLLARRGDGSLWIIKGGHRHQVLQLLDHEWVPVIVVDVESLRDEADMFYVDASGIRGLSIYVKHKANTVRQDPSTLAMNATVERFGLRLASFNSPSTISAVGSVENVWRMGGEELLADVLGIVSGVWSQSDKSREGEIIAGLGFFLRSARTDPNMDRVRLNALLGEHMPATVMALAIESAYDRGRGVQGSGRTTLFALQLRDLYNAKWPRKKLAPLLTPSGKRMPGQVGAR